MILAHAVLQIFCSQGSIGLQCNSQKNGHNCALTSSTEKKKIRVHLFSFLFYILNFKILSLTFLPHAKCNGCKDGQAQTNMLSQSLNANPLRKGGKTIDLYCYIKVLKVKPVYQQMTLSPKLGVVGISTLWHFRLPLPIQMFIKVASSPRLSGIGLPSLIL